MDQRYFTGFYIIITNFKHLFIEYVVIISPFVQITDKIVWIHNSFIRDKVRFS